MELDAVEEDPVAELVEFNEPTLVFVHLVEELLHVGHGDLVGFEEGNGVVEFAEGDLLVVVFVDLVEEGPVDVVVLYITEQVGELSLGHEVIPILGHGFQPGLGGVEGPLDDWSQGEEVWQFDDEAHSLIDLGQTQVAVLVLVKQGPVSVNLLLISRCIATRQFLVNHFDDLCRL